MNQINNNVIKPYTFIEVCAGAGGLSKGFIDNGFNPLLLNDNNKVCLKNSSARINKLVKYFDNLPFSFKTSFLLFIISGGMIIIIFLSQISIYTLKNDFDILFEKRTKPIIQLENIKDTYKINIFDTFNDIQKKSIDINQSKDIITLGQQLINNNWKNYKRISLIKENEKS